jgi:hypothetical protein
MLELFERLAFRLGSEGWTLRSGCAPGADSAFERGAWRAVRDAHAPKPELYLPWRSFESRTDVGGGLWQPQEVAFEIAAPFHPVWEKLSRGARALHARNCHQILGRDVTRPVPARFVCCWTKGGTGKGGTGQALRLASHYGIEVVDAGSEAGLERLLAYAA